MAGERYRLHNVQDYHGDVLTGVYDGTAITIPIAGREKFTEQPYGWRKPWINYPDPNNPRTNTFPDFGVFVLQNTTRNGAYKHGIRDTLDGKCEGALRPSPPGVPNASVPQAPGNLRVR